MGKIYAVKKGKKPGIYYSWNECREQVNGFNGAEFKSFKTEEECNEYLGIGLNKKDDEENPLDLIKEAVMYFTNEAELSDEEQIKYINAFCKIRDMYNGN